MPASTPINNRQGLNLVTNINRFTNADIKRTFRTLGALCLKAEVGAVAMIAEASHPPENSRYCHNRAVFLARATKPENE